MANTTKREMVYAIVSSVTTTRCKISPTVANKHLRRVTDKRTHGRHADHARHNFTTRLYKRRIRRALIRVCALFGAGVVDQMASDRCRNSPSIVGALTWHSRFVTRWRGNASELGHIRESGMVKSAWCFPSVESRRNCRGVICGVTFEALLVKNLAGI